VGRRRPCRSRGEAQVLSRRTGIRRLAALGALGTLAAGCGSTTGDSTTTTAPASAGGDPAKAVVAVEGVYPGRRTQVTGVIFEPQQGLILTADHAIENAPSITVRLADGRITHATALARAQCHDLAVLKLFPRQSGLTALAPADSDAVAVGQPVSTLTYRFKGRGGTPASARVPGTISAVSVRAAFPPLPRTGPFFAHRTTLPPSASGSPVIDEQNRLIGLETLIGHPRRPDVAGIEYALTSSYIRTRLRELRRGVGGALAGWGAEHGRCHAALQQLIGLGHTHAAAGP
jgi:S1-C subfamily serine protease